MNTTRINHTGHNHPSTTAARTACRKAMKATPPAEILIPTFMLVVVGKGKVRHAANLGHDGKVLGARCGAGLQRGMRAASSFTFWASDVNDVNCNRCR